MASGFIEKTGDTFFLNIFDKTPQGYSFRERRELKQEDSYLAGVLEKLDNIYLDVPFHSLHFRILTLPFSEREKIENIIPFQLEGMTVESTDNIVYDFTVIGKKDDKYGIAVVFVSKEVLGRIAAALSDYGIKPEVITTVDAYEALSTRSVESLAGLKTLSDEERTSVMEKMLSSETINLAKGEFSYRRDIEKGKRYLKTAAVLTCAVSLLLSVHFLLDARNIDNGRKDLKRKMTEVYANLIPEDRKIINPLYQLKSQVKRLQWKVEEFNDIRPLDLLESIARNRVSAGSAESIKITSDFITVKGETESADKVQAVADALGAVTNSTPVIETKQTAGEKVGYTIQLGIERK